MGFESFNPESQNQPETKEVGLELNKENILNGRGLEEVERVGWQKYRESLASLSYGDIVERQVTEIHTIESRNASPIPEWIIEGKNQESLGRTIKMAEWFQQEYGKEKLFSFSASIEKGKKLWIQGCNVELDNNRKPVERPVARVYFGVPTRSAPEAFKELFTALVDENVMRNVDVALNLESYQGDSLDKESEDNTIVLYVYGEKPEVMNKVVHSIVRAKTSNPDVWKLSPSGLAKNKEKVVRSLMVPLDETTAFAEMPNLDSYHSDAAGRLVHEVTGNPPFIPTSLDDFSKQVKDHTARFTSSFEEFPERKRNMPALVIK